MENSTNKKISIQEIIYNIRDATVNISGQIIIIDSNKSTKSMKINNGNGFFINGHYIICPASLVLIPPTLIGKKEILQHHPNMVLNGKYFNNMIRVTKILVTVSNINKCHRTENHLQSDHEDINDIKTLKEVKSRKRNIINQSYSYEADLIGVDGASNIAILRINMNHDWNTNNPPIRSCHPCLKWGKSRNLSPGDKILLIGETAGYDSMGLSSNFSNLSTKLNNIAESAVAIGNIGDNRYLSYGGKVPGELLLLSNIITKEYRQGLPVVTLDGKIVGMLLYVNGTSSNIALSEFFMRRPIKALIKSFIDKSISNNCIGFVEIIDDPISNYYKFNKSWLGLGGILMNQNDYNTNIEVDNDLNITRIPVDNNNIKCKEIVGYRILAIAGLYSNSVNFFIPGDIENPYDSNIPILKSSPLYNIIHIGDIVTHINDCPLGDRKCQISPALAMWRIKPNNIVKITYKKQTEFFEYEHTVNMKTGSYEPFYDFPWYSIIIPNTLESMMPILI